MLGLTLQGAPTGRLVGTAVAFIVFLALQFWTKKARRTSIGRPDQAMPPKPTVPEIDGELG